MRNYRKLRAELEARPDHEVRSAVAGLRLELDAEVADSTGRLTEALVDLAMGDTEKLLDHAGAISYDEVMAVQRHAYAVLRYTRAVCREWHSHREWPGIRQIEPEGTTYYCAEHDRHLPCRACLYGKDES